MTTPDEALAAFNEARGVPAPERIWLIFIGGGDTVWSTEPDPEGEGEPSVGYVLDRAGQSANAERAAVLEHVASDLLRHIDWLTKGLPDLLESGGLTDEEGLIGAAVDAANSARAALEGRAS